MALLDRLRVQAMQPIEKANGKDPRNPNGKDPRNPFAELGVSSAAGQGRGVYTDFLPQLSSSNAQNVYREMSDNDAVIGGIMFGTEQLMRALTWTAVPTDPDSPDDIAAAVFVQENMGGMEHTWDDHIGLAVTMATYGFAWFETVYERRDGIRWKRFGFRPQWSVASWVTDAHGEVEAITQQLDSTRVNIPVDKSVYYRTRTDKPEGRSWLRNAYRAWYIRKSLETILSIGAKRDLTGLPLATMPGENFASEDATYQRVIQMVRRIGVDEQQGVVLPSDVDPETGNAMFTLEMVSSPGTSKVNVIEAIRMFSGDVAGSMIADWLGLGRDAVGSRALAEPKQELWRMSLESLADNISATLTQHAVPTLLRLNAMGGTTRVKHSPVKDIDLGEFGTALRDAAQAGFIFDDESARSEVRATLGFDPEPDAFTT